MISEKEKERTKNLREAVKKEKAKFSFDQDQKIRDRLFVNNFFKFSTIFLFFHFTLSLTANLRSYSHLPFSYAERGLALTKIKRSGIGITGRRITIETRESDPGSG